MVLLQWRLFLPSVPPLKLVWEVVVAMAYFIASFCFVLLIHLCLLTSFLATVDSRLDAIMRKANFIKPKRVAIVEEPRL